MNIQTYRDYRLFLRDELEARLGANPMYSLRAFARDIRISPQMLSLVLNGKKGLSNEMALRVADRLELDPEGAEHFADLVLLARASGNDAKVMVERRLREKSLQAPYTSIDSSAFRIISDWHHYAILELLQTEDFRSDTAWMAQRLGLKPFEVEQALDRLEKLELLERDARGRWKRTEVNMSAIYSTPNAALRKLAKQYLEKAISSLESQDIDERDITNITMAIDPDRLPEAKNMIAKFRRKICQFLEGGNRSEVYVFAPSLFKLSKNQSENKR